MSEMDWETTSPPFTSQPNAEQVQCPYRQSNERSNMGNFPGAPPGGIIAFNQPQPTPRMYWDNGPRLNPPSHGGLNIRFPPMQPNPHLSGRPSELSSFDYQMGLDHQSHASGPPRNARFEGNRPPFQQNRSYLNGTPGTDNQGGLLNNAVQIPPSSMDPGANYNGGMARRPGASAAMALETSAPQLINSPNRHLPPPNSAYPSIHLQQNAQYHRQARFSTDLPLPGVPQGLNHSASPHSPPIPREPNWGRAEASMASAAHQDWFREQFYSTQMADLDSDEDSIEAQEENLRRQGRMDPATLQFLQDSMRLSGHRRANPPNDPDEMSIERTRAARRAAAAAVKFVASADALASLVKVDLEGLTGGDRSCIICYNEFGLKNPDGFVELPVRLPKCKHVFGDRCLKQWLQDSDSCPYCRDKLPSEPKRSQSGETRRVFSHARTLGIDPWIAAEASRIHADPVAAAAEREQQYQQLLQQRMRQRDDNHDDLLARNRRRDDLDWTTSYNQPQSMVIPSRMMSDHDTRRRYRGRVNRTVSQISNRANGLGSARSARTPNLQAGPMRTASHNNTPSFDESSTSQRRSVTPHPTITGHPTWPSPPRVQPTVAGRPSSLPTERSPLGEASDVQPDAMASRTSSGSSTISNPLDRPWSESHGHTANSYMGWMIPTSNGRPASATFINEMPQTRLMQLHDDMTNPRLPPYLSNLNDAAFNDQAGNLNRR